MVTYYRQCMVYRGRVKVAEWSLRDWTLTAAAWTMKDGFCHLLQLSNVGM